MTIHSLLVITFELDDTSPVLGWQAQVVRALAQRLDRVGVMTDRLGSFDAPDNVRVEVNTSPTKGLLGRAQRLVRVERTLNRVIREESIEACFVHMNHRAVPRDAAVARLHRLPVLLWYAHGTVTPSLRIAHRLSSRVVTSTPEGFRVPSRKVHVIGQGIDLSSSSPRFGPVDGDLVITTGRITPRKRLDLVIEAAALLYSRRPDSTVRFRVIGPTLTEDDEAFKRQLSTSVSRRGLDGRVELSGPIPSTAIAGAHQQAFLHLNLSETGSMDKTVLEALAAGVPVLTSNPAFRSLLGDHPEMYLSGSAAGDVADAILSIHDSRDRVDRSRLRALVDGRHDLDSYADRVCEHLDDLVRAGDLP